MMSYIGISLWDQSIVEWYMLLAFVGAVVVPRARTAKRQITDAAVEEIGAPADAQPAYTVWTNRKLRDQKSRTDRAVAWTSAARQGPVGCDAEAISRQRQVNIICK